MHLDPQYAEPWLGLTGTWLRLASPGAIAPRSVMEDARAALQTGMRLNPDPADAQFLAALIAWRYDWDWPAADRRFRAAIELDPHTPTYRIFYAAFLSQMGRHEEALQQAEAGRRAEPLAGVRAVEANIYYNARDYDRTIRLCRAWIEKDAHFQPYHYWLGRALLSKGQTTEALRHSRRTSAPAPGRGFGMLAAAYVQAVRRSEAVKLLEDALQRSRDTYVSPLSVAQIYIALDQPETALDWIDRGLADRDFAITTLNTEPAYDPLRRHPRFTAILARLRF
ncbi:MAG: hypothetical protein SFV54_25260 [Bryobacteraceae bacterium]|nr:hypothetical protein [Bryobacteraceae bacterium]